MLHSLSIRDVVLVDKLDLTFHPGLSVLTGETGAGKSILLDALGLALGMRASPALLRHGARQATVTAAFSLPDGHPAHDVLAENGLADEDLLLLRRVVSADGKSRAFVNDQPASAGLLRRLGDSLVEIQGQAEQHGLLDAATHRALVDAYGGHAAMAGAAAAAWRAWRAAEEALAAGRAELESARREEAFLRHSAAELEALDPRPGEERALAETRAVLRNRERLVDALNAAREAVAEAADVEGALRSAEAALARAAGAAGGRLDDVAAAFGRARAELQEALGQLEAAGRDIELDSGRLQEVEDRFFALKEIARKHRVEVDALAALRDRFRGALAALEDQGGALARLERGVDEARAAYLAAAERLSRARAAAAAALDAAMKAELPPLKLEQAAFRTRIDRLAESAWGAHGIDRVAFEAATNPGVPPGPIARIASGGELARLMLALKVVLARVGSAPTLVFDEVDSGIGGATAHAVGERLARLGRELQILVVTHSPQVAARGGHHWRVVKAGARRGAVTVLDELGEEARREEIARMLSGRQVTDAARAAAASLLAGERIDA